MCKPLAGKRAFYAKGQRDKARGVLSVYDLLSKDWPRWARLSYIAGFFGH